MWQHWCTREHGAGRSVEFWHDAVRHGVIESDFDTDSTQDFSGAMYSRARADVRMVNFSCTAHRIRHSHTQARRQNGDHLMLSLQTEGGAHISQGHGSVELTPGSLALIDAGRAFRIDFPQDTARRLVLLPRSLLSARAPALRQLDNPVVLPAQASLAPVLAASVQVLTDPRHGLEDSTVDMLLRTVVETLSASFAAHAGARRQVTEMSFDTMRRYVDMHLSDCELSPARVAAACGMSVRTLHRLFGRHADTSFESYVVDGRLKLAHALLESGSAGSVGDAAFASGFNNLSHFARRFSERYGAPPSHVLRAGRTAPG
ncbi:helix-turn-helix domain-containing protein [Verticiella sediminum]